MKPLRLTILFLILLTVGCAPARPEVDFSPYVWPKPPEPPKIKLIKSITTDLDIRKSSFLEKLFGEDITFAFGKPHGIAADKNGNIYVADNLWRKVFIINLDTGHIDNLFNPYGWKAPLYVAVDNTNGLIAVTDAAVRRVYVYTLHKRKLKYQLGQRGEFKNPVGVAFDPDRNRLYINDSKKHEIYAYTNEGEFLFKVAGIGREPGEVHYPSAMATDKEGKLYVVDTMNFRTQIFDPEGNVVKVFGEHGDRPGMFARPKGITVSDDGYIFVTDAAFGNFQIFDREGKIYLFVGSPGQGLGMFNIPQGIFIDENDKIYVVDQINRRVQVFQYLSDRYLKKEKQEGTAGQPVEVKEEEQPVLIEEGTEQ